MPNNPTGATTVPIEPIYQFVIQGMGNLGPPVTQSLSQVEGEGWKVALTVS